MLNMIVLMGRLTDEPKYTATKDGKSCVHFSIACDQDYKKETDFIPCVAFGKTAEFITQYFRKGSMIAVNGRLHINKYTDKDGNKRSQAEVVVDHSYFAGAKPSTGDFQPPANAAPEYPELTDDDGEMPF